MALSGSEAAAKLEKGIGNIKNVLFCLNIIALILGLILFGMTLWVRFDTDIQTWVEQLLISDFYWGVWILILFSVISVGSTFLSGASTITEHPTLLLANTGAQMLCFVVGMIGAAMLKDYSTYKSEIQPVIRRQMLRLISMYPEDNYATNVLKTIQENVGCCGADGANDYIGLKRALPAECRDTVTGNCYFHGCVDEVTWTLDERCYWPIGIAITQCFIHVVNSVLSFSLLQAVQKQDEVLAMFSR